MDQQEFQWKVHHSSPEYGRFWPRVTTLHTGSTSKANKMTSQKKYQKSLFPRMYKLIKGSLVRPCKTQVIETNKMVILKLLYIIKKKKIQIT